MGLPLIFASADPRIPETLRLFLHGPSVSRVVKKNRLGSAGRHHRDASQVRHMNARQSRRVWNSTNAAPLSPHPDDRGGNMTEGHNNGMPEQAEVFPKLLRRMSRRWGLRGLGGLCSGV